MRRVIALPDDCEGLPPQWEAFEAFTMRALLGFDRKWPADISGYELTE